MNGLFQFFVLLLNTKDILKNVSNQTIASMLIDMHGIFFPHYGSQWVLLTVTHNLQNIFYVQQKKGLEGE